MRAYVVYESMFGNTRQIAHAIGAGIDELYDVTVLPVADVSEAVWSADLLVVGGPTHVHGMSRARSRAQAVVMANKPLSGLTLEPGAEGAGLREWLSTRIGTSARFAAFDTRMTGPEFFTGRASKRIDAMLRKHGGQRTVAPVSFLVTRDNELVAGELERAKAWGERVARVASAGRSTIAT